MQVHADTGMESLAGCLDCMCIAGQHNQAAWSTGRPGPASAARALTPGRQMLGPPRCGTAYDTS